jgi:hypothetical protein
MRQRFLWLALSVSSFLLIFTLSDSTQATQRRKQKRNSSKVVAPAKKTPHAIKESTPSHDIGIEVKSNPFGRLIILTNREKSPITIRKIIVNDEWDVKDNPNLLHSTKSWVSLPVELKLGDTLRVPLTVYRRAIIYVDLETDKGALTFKVSR